MFDVHVVLGDGAWQETLHGNAVGETCVPSAERYSETDVSVVTRSSNHFPITLVRVCHRIILKLLSRLWYDILFCLLGLLFANVN